MKLPEQLCHLDAQPRGAEWLERLSDLVRECADEWSLTVGEPYEYAFVSLALRVELPDRTPAVLKIGFPHRESEHEAEALAHYDGLGAVTLLAYDRARQAMLLERCTPGRSLLDVHDETEAFRIACRILERLWKPPDPGHSFRPIAVDAARWVQTLPERWEHLGRPFEQVLIEELVGALVELPPTQGELVVCHQDFHRGNVLSAQREPWLTIDPKPVLAEREFDTAALIRDGDGNVSWRLDFLSSELDLDRERMRRWALAHTLAWAFDESEPNPDDIDLARRLAAARA
ncbi:MAG: aminoglycoside phosphotransferase family protein [Actinomycetota bacterium]